MARSMKQLIETIEELRVKGIGLRSLIRERTQAGLAAARRVGARGRAPAETHGGRHRGRQGDAG